MPNGALALDMIGRAGGMGHTIMVQPPKPMVPVALSDSGRRGTQQLARQARMVAGNRVGLAGNCPLKQASVKTQEAWAPNQAWQ